MVVRAEVRGQSLGASFINRAQTLPYGSRRQSKQNTPRHGTCFFNMVHLQQKTNILM